MAEFGEGFELCKVPKEVDLLGLERHSEDDFVILTLRNREVLVYNVADRKIIKSWSVEPNQMITCPAVQDFLTKTYYMVRNKKELLTWNDSVSDLKKANIVQLTKAVNRIHICSSRRFSHEPVIVFKDNNVLPVSLAGKEVKKTSEEPKQRLRWCGIHKSSDGKIWFCKVTSQDATKLVLVLQLFEHSLTGKQHVYNIRSPGTDAKPLCWCLLDDKELSFFVSVWSDGCIYKSKIPIVESVEINEDMIPVLDCELISRLSDASLSLSKKPCVHLCYVTSSFICVAGTSSSDESTKAEDVLSLWDMKFGTLHSQKKLTPGISHLQCTSSFVIVAGNSSVNACSYYAEKSTLRNSLGMLHVKRKSKSNKPIFLATPDLIKPSQSVQDWSDLATKADETEDELIERLLDPNKIKTAEQLSSELQKYFQDRLPKADNSQELSKRQQRKNASRPAIVSQYFVTSIFERCVKEKELWSRKTWDFFLKTNILPQRCLSEFLSLVLENNDMKLLENCLQNLNGIPESCIVACLKYCLRANDHILGPRESTEQWQQTDPPCGLFKAKYLCLILSYPVNDVFLQESLKTLPFDETLLFIKFLLHIITRWSLPLRDLLQSEDCKHKLTFSQILDWASYTLNSHFTQLIILPEAQTLLVNLHEAVAEQIKTYEQLNQLEGYLSHFKKHELLPRKDCQGAYSVESLRL